MKQTINIKENKFRVDSLAFNLFIKEAVKSSEKVKSDGFTERELILLAQKGDIAARNKLVELHILFAVSAAKSLCVDKNDVEDLIQVACIGLISAVAEYDITKGVKFLSYAAWHIRKEVNIYFMNKRLIRLPANIYMIDIQIKKNVTENNESDFEKLKEKHNYNTKEIRAAKSLIENSISRSYDVPLYENSDTTIIDRYSNSRGSNLAFIANGSRDLFVEKALNFLTPEYKETLKKHLALPPYIEKHTLKEIGESQGISKEAVRLRLLTIKKRVKKHITTSMQGWREEIEENR